MAQHLKVMFVFGRAYGHRGASIIERRIEPPDYGEL